MASQREVEYQESIKTHTRITIPVVFDVESSKTGSEALAFMITTIAKMLATQERQYRYNWDGAWVDATSLGDIKHTALPLKAIPELDEETVPEEA